MRPRITIRMGASRFDATVRGHDGNPVHFDLYKMDEKGRHNFRRTLVSEFREAQGS